MTDKIFTKRCSRPALLGAFAMAGALAVSISFVPTAARAGDDGDGSFLGPVLRIIGVDPSSGAARPSIHYRQRAPLVLPKTMSLPAPQPRAAVRDAAWPRDPDVLRAQRAAALARAPSTEPGLDAGMSKRDMMKSRDVAVTPGGAAACGEFSGETCDPHKIWAALSVKKSETKSDDNYVVGKAPPRKYLTEPPSGYMVPTKILRPTIAKRIDPNADDNPNVYFRDQARRQQSVD